MGTFYGINGDDTIDGNTLPENTSCLTIYNVLLRQYLCQ
jgi:hypothetical protein